MFLAYLGPSSGSTIICIQQLVLIILFRWLSVVHWIPISHLKRIIITNCCIHMVVPPDDGPRYAWSLWRLTKYSKNKLCMTLVFLYKIISRCTVVKNIKFAQKLSHSVNDLKHMNFPSQWWFFYSHHSGRIIHTSSSIDFHSEWVVCNVCGKPDLSMVAIFCIMNLEWLIHAQMWISYCFVSVICPWC
jgi:hypothetical protein